MSLHFSGNFIKREGRLAYVNRSTEQRFTAFASRIEEGKKIDVYMELMEDDGTLAQLAKIHALIRVLASHTGTTFEAMKLYVKDKAGLCINRTILGKEYTDFKSFGKASKEELSQAIQACIEIGENVNIVLD